ncbi:MAG TPA: ThiF family adenylyltransferase [Nitratidesulfovibrio sp.]|nr:ThiF family adenylyltransferase [Nitratidesulfovibrio sp.]
MNIETARFRLRPSVSFIPPKEDGRCHFFISDTRKSVHFIIQNQIYIQIISALSGNLTTSELLQKYSLSTPERLGIFKLFETLINESIIEDADAIATRLHHPYRRVLNFLGSLLPYHEVDDAFERLSNSHAVIVGAGGVGSWVALNIAQLGVKNLTLIDNDIVSAHNLNRSFFKNEDIGKRKAIALADSIRSRNPAYYNTAYFLRRIEKPDHLSDIIENKPPQSTVVISCADEPSAYEVAAAVHDAAYSRSIPYIVAGGYNMHLSLIGPTVIPNTSPCLHCIRHGMDANNPDDLTRAVRLNKIHRNIGNIAPLASISASFVAHEFLKIVIRNPKTPPTMTGGRGEFNFHTKQLIREEYSQWTDCIKCTSTRQIFIQGQR